jgi:hypothetical protein
MAEEHVIQDWRQWQEDKIEEILDELMHELEDEPLSPCPAALASHARFEPERDLPEVERPCSRQLEPRVHGDRAQTTVVLRSATVTTAASALRQSPPIPPRPPVSFTRLAEEAWPKHGLFSDRQLLVAAIALLGTTAILTLAHILRMPDPQQVRQQAFLAHLQETLTALDSEAAANQPPAPTALSGDSKPQSIAPDPATASTGLLDRPKVTLPPPAASLIPPSRAPLAVVRVPTATLPPPPPVLPPTTLAVPDLPLGSPLASPPTPSPINPGQATAAQSPVAIAPTPAAKGLRLKGVMVMDNSSAAMFSLDGTIQPPIRVGEAVGTSGWRLKRVDSQSAVLERNGKQRVVGIDSGLY